MVRSIPLQPPPGAWIAYQVDEAHDDGTWDAVAARPVDGRPPASTSVAFTDQAVAFRVVWVGEGGSKNMVIGPRTEFDAPTARVRR